MLLRLILALVLALGGTAMPAAAHDGAQPMAMAGHAMPGMDNRDRKAPMPMQHLCIGCVPMDGWNAARVTPPVVVPAPAPIAGIAALSVLPGEAPAPPPPRIA
jgi:hypothetical protein